MSRVKMYYAIGGRNGRRQHVDHISVAFGGGLGIEKPYLESKLNI